MRTIFIALFATSLSATHAVTLANPVLMDVPDTTNAKAVAQAQCAIEQFSKEIPELNAANDADVDFTGAFRADSSVGGGTAQQAKYIIGAQGYNAAGEPFFRAFDFLIDTGTREEWKSFGYGNVGHVGFTASTTLLEAKMVDSQSKKTIVIDLSPCAAAFSQ